jgi:hypothetical protein
MDKTGAGHYRPVMLRLLLLIVSACLFAVVSFTASAHGTGMIVSAEFGSRMQHMDHASSSQISCFEDGTCSTQSGLCELVCMGVGVFLPPERIGAHLAALRETYRRHPGTTLVSTPPVLDDRPPIAHLL